MTADSLIEKRAQRPPDRRGAFNGALPLGWAHLWLLMGILGGMLALVGFVFLAYLSEF
jgi:hypothetical protein